jgi:hypothetical protein
MIEKWNSGRLGLNSIALKNMRSCVSDHSSIIPTFTVGGKNPVPLKNI